MEHPRLEKLQELLQFADFIEQCQTKNLITPEERTNYIETLNGQTHTEIDKLLKEE